MSFYKNSYGRNIYWNILFCDSLLWEMKHTMTDVTWAYFGEYCFWRGQLHVIFKQSASRRPIMFDSLCQAEMILSMSQTRPVGYDCVRLHFLFSLWYPETFSMKSITRYGRPCMIRCTLIFRVKGWANSVKRGGEQLFE